MNLRIHHRLYGYGQLFAFSGIDATPLVRATSAPPS